MKKQILTIISLILVLSITLCSCNKANDTVSVSLEEETPLSTNLRPIPATTNDGTINLTKDLKAGSVNGKNADQTFINAQADFAVELFKQTVKNDENKNILISPLSVQLVLAMASNGADGETKKEFEKLMGGITVENLNQYLYSYIDGLDSTGAKLDISNSIWVRNGFEVKEDFLKINKDYYNTDIFSADFNADTINDINKWASDKTEGMIKELLSDNTLDKHSVMCLINTLIFDTPWLNEYEGTDETQEFTNISGEKKKVKSLKTITRYYYSNDTSTGFKKELADEKFSFVALLPNKNININDYINSLTGKQLLNTLNSPEYIFPYTEMPEFEYEYSCKNMPRTLFNMGLKTAFDQYEANFSKIADNTSIDKFIHKTKISVNEVGVKASAASAAVFLTLGGGAPSEKEVIIDRPFVYMIIDNKTNLPIFIGTVMDI